MKLASDQPDGLVHGLSALSLSSPASKYLSLLRVFLGAMSVAIGALLFALLLPARLVPFFQDIACWGFVGGIAALTLLMTVKVLDGLLDS